MQYRQKVNWWPQDGLMYTGHTAVGSLIEHPHTHSHHQMSFLEGHARLSLKYNIVLRMRPTIEVAFFA